MLTASTLARVAEVVLNENSLKKRPKDNNPVWKLLEDFLTKRGQAKIKTNKGRQVKAELTFEKSIKCQVETSMKKKETKTLIEGMAQMLLKEDKQHRYSHTCSDTCIKVYCFGTSGEYVHQGL